MFGSILANGTNAYRRELIVMIAAMAFGTLNYRVGNAEVVVGGMQYGIVTIHNKTSRVIHYSYRTGNGDWHETTIEPNHYRSYSHKYAYPNENRSPKLHIRFDSDMTSGVAKRQVTLDRKSAAYVRPEFGRHYDFKEMSDDQINLYAR